MDEYQLAARQEAIRLSSVAEGHVEDAYESNGNSDAYVFAAVLFAVVLFFAAVSGKMSYMRNRLIVLAFGIFVLIGTSIFLSSFPSRSESWPRHRHSTQSGTGRGLVRSAGESGVDMLIARGILMVRVLLATISRGVV
jgi:hypothetical protein